MDINHKDIIKSIINIRGYLVGSTMRINNIEHIILPKEYIMNILQELDGIVDKLYTGE